MRIKKIDRIKLWFLVYVGVCFCFSVYSAPNIDLNKIIYIESGGNARARNDISGAVGLCQITKPCLEDWNNSHKNEQYTINDIYNPTINIKIASWYLEERIPQMLSYYNKEINVENILWAYNAGIGKLLKGIKPEETKQYIKEYKELDKSKAQGTFLYYYVPAL